MVLFDTERYTKSKQLQHTALLRDYQKVFESAWHSGTYHSQKSRAGDFEKIKQVGKGAFGVTYLAKKTDGDTYYAMKTFEMRGIIRHQQLEYCKSEKKILCSLDFPFITRIKYYFRDNVYLYFLEPFYNGGDLFRLLSRTGKLEESVAKFFGAQLVLALEYLHFCDLIYRDLKLENVLLTINGYVKIVDFTFSKLVKVRTFTTCGTPNYLAPEMILNLGYGNSVDWWALGVLLYELTASYTPFYAHEPMLVYEKVIAGVYRTPDHFSRELINLLAGCMEIDVSKRLGNLKDGALDFKTHEWFAGLDWDGIMKQEVDAPLKPKCLFDFDTSNFDESLETVPIKVQSHCSLQEYFCDF